MAATKISKEDKAAIARLKEAGQELTGEETSAELETMVAALDAEGGDGSTGEREVLAGVPDKLPVKYEILIVSGKETRFPVHFVAAVQGGRFALYNEFGVRISGAYGANDHIDPTDTSSQKAVMAINKMAATNNALRRKSHRL